MQKEEFSMSANFIGNLLMVSNYPSDTAYAWWLMEHFWKTQAELFEQTGQKTFLAYPKITSLSETIKNSPIIPVELTIPWSSKEKKREAKEFIAANNIRCIYFTDQPFFCSQYAEMKRMGIERIVVHDHTPGDRKAVSGIKGFLKSLKHSLPRYTADSVLCVSELMRQRNLTNIRIPENKCIVVQNGIAPVICNDKQYSRIRNALGIRQDSILIVTTGRAHPYKRFDYIIECARSIQQTKPELDIVFMLVGDGPAMPELKNTVKRYGLEYNVRLLGLRNDVRDILCVSDIALHAALGEGFSLSIIEYMSAGLPVLAPDIPSVSQAIKHGETGYIYPANNTDEVINYIFKLINDENLRKTISNTAKLKANTEFNLERCTAEFIKAVKSIYH